MISLASLALLASLMGTLSQALTAKARRAKKNEKQGTGTRRDTGSRPCFALSAGFPHLRIYRLADLARLPISFEFAFA